METIKSKSIYIFGSRSLVGNDFNSIINSSNFSHDFNIRRFSRQSIEDHLFLDMSYPHLFKPISSDRSINIVSFAPIWHLAEFLCYLKANNNSYFSLIHSIIACSSTSAITKKFSFNAFDQKLSRKLIDSENTISLLSIDNGIPYYILRPTMIYGSSGPFSDSNVSVIIKLMRSLPLVLLPLNSGLRQPIHSYQLAAVVKNLLVYQLPLYNTHDHKQNHILNVGGDEEISFKTMILRIAESLPYSDKAKQCLVLSIPKQLFYFLIFPVVFISPKLYEALLRMKANLSGFTKSFTLSKLSRSDFPFIRIYDK